MSGKVVQRSITMTEEMRSRLQQLVNKHGRDYTESDLIREALRLYLDEQEDIIGSRRHFQKSFQDRLDRLEHAQSFHLNVALHVLAAGLAVILTALTKDKVTASQLIRNGIIAARRDNALTAQIAAVRDMPDQPDGQ